MALMGRRGSCEILGPSLACQIDQVSQGVSKYRVKGSRCCSSLLCGARES